MSELRRPSDPLNSPYYRTCCGSAHVETIFTVFVILDVISSCLSILSSLAKHDRSFYVGIAIMLAFIAMEVHGRRARAPWVLLVLLVIGILGFVGVLIAVLLVVTTWITQATRGRVYEEYQFANLNMNEGMGIALVAALLVLWYSYWRISVIYRCRRYYVEIQEIPDLPMARTYRACVVKPEAPPPYSEVLLDEPPRSTYRNYPEEK